MINKNMTHTVDVIIDDPQWQKHHPDWEIFLTRVVSQSLEHLGWKLPVEVCITLANDETIQPLNNEYRGKDKPTNSLSFPSYEKEELIEFSGMLPVVLGDIVIAYETMLKEAIDQNKQFIDHVMHITIHGLLHLLGYDHIIDAEAEEMEALEIKLLKTFNVDNPYI